MPTISTLYQPLAGNHNDYTPPRMDYLVTTGSGATDGGMEVFADPAASNNFYLTCLNVSFINPTNTAVFSTYVGTKKVITYPTMAAGVTVSYSHAFGNPGAGGGVTTTTATVSIVGDGSNTATVQFYATGYRLK